MNLTPGTQLRFTNNDQLFTDTFCSGEGIVLYAASAEGFAAHTIVTYRNKPDFTHPSTFRLRPEGD